jgi:acyl-CoA thioesterase-1
MQFSTFIAALVVVTSLRATPAHAAPIKVACVGDSITQNSGWSDKLGMRLGAGYTSTNYGVTGTTLLKQGDSTYWTTPAFTQSHSSNPDIVVIMLGTNDSKPQNWNAHKGEFVGDYEALIDSYAALPSHPKIYLNLCPPAGTNGYGISGTVIENEVLPDIKQIATTKGLPTIDVFTAFGGHTLDQSLYGSTADLVHPNAKGAQVIADTVYAALTAAPSDGGTDGPGAGGDARDARADSAPSTGGDASSEAPASTSGAGGAAGTGSATGTGGSGGTTGAAGTTGSGGTGVRQTSSGSSGCALSGRGSDRSVSGLLAGLVVGLAALMSWRRRRAR